MPITDKQREQRRKHLGSSDMAAVMGLSVYANPADVYHHKIGDIVESEGEQDSPAIEVGNWLEPSLLDWGAHRLGVKIRKNQRRVKGIFAANIDALVVGKPWLLEAKTTGVTNSFFKGEEWGQEMTAEVPVHVLVQTHQQMYVADLEVAFVPALVNGRGFQMFRVDRNESLIRDVVRAGERFWQHVENRVRPEETPSLDTLKVLVREPAKEVDLTDDVVNEFLISKENKRIAEARYKEAQRALIAALGDAEVGNSNVARVTYFEQTQNRVDTKALREQYPDVATEVTKPRTYRVLRDKSL